MVGVAVLYTGVSVGPKEGGLKEEQSRGGRGGDMEISGGSASGPGNNQGKGPGVGPCPGHWRVRSWPGRRWGSRLLPWADQPCHLTCMFTAPSPNMYRTTQWGRRAVGKPPAPPDLEQGGHMRTVEMDGWIAWGQQGKRGIREVPCLFLHQAVGQSGPEAS